MRQVCNAPETDVFGVHAEYRQGLSITDKASDVNPIERNQNLSA